jgi:hypothetical protein
MSGELFHTQRVIIFTGAGGERHFDVTVDMRKIAEAQAVRAMRNRSHISVVAGGAVKVEYIP